MATSARSSGSDCQSSAAQPYAWIIGPNAARYVGLGDQIGTLEPGKLADIILIDGNPTLNIYEMLKTKVVLKEGKVVIDKR